ncbi:MAG: phosphoribosyltransferase [Rhodobiaceae bacterium]|nr:phosphoribosyltransferase [Rhodobiaceae bacterium]
MFANRADAGKTLAAAVARYLAGLEDRADPIVLALPRGGVPVALEVALALGLPLGLALVRKVGVPGYEELAAGAVIDGDAPEFVPNEQVMREARLTRRDLEPVIARELAEIDKRRQAYLRGREPAPITGRTVIVVDDGIATGATVRAALRGLRRRAPARLVLAVPVAPADTLARLKDAVDEIICLQVPADFRAVGLYYRDFSQTTDAEVIAALDTAAS